MTQNSHPFETAGLGQAPFRFVGMAKQDMLYGEVILNRAEYERTGIALTTKPGGTCAYCGTHIVNMYDIQSADGRRFHVGSDCVAKIADAALVSAVRRASLKADRVKRAAKAEAVLVELRTKLADEGARGQLASAPHPRGFEGSTLLHWAERQLTHAGATGRAKALSAVRAVLGA